MQNRKILKNIFYYEKYSKKPKNNVFFAKKSKNNVKNMKLSDFSKNPQAQKNCAKILKMPAKKSLLSDTEINSLFFGLVKLVKKSAEESAQMTLNRELKLANDTLRATIKKLAEAEREVENLRQKIAETKQQNRKLQFEAENLRCQLI